ncbi:hypothetical protein HDU67_002773, partial [Dinochytrium kinnereticum]
MPISTVSGSSPLTTASAAPATSPTTDRRGCREDTVPSTSTMSTGTASNGPTGFPSPKLPPRPASAFPAPSSHYHTFASATSPASFYGNGTYHRSVYAHLHFGQHFGAQGGVGRKPVVGLQNLAGMDSGKSGKGQQPSGKAESSQNEAHEEEEAMEVLTDETFEEEMEDVDGMSTTTISSESLLKRTTSCSALSIYAAALAAVSGTTSPTPSSASTAVSHETPKAMRSCRMGCDCGSSEEPMKSRKVMGLVSPVTPKSSLHRIAASSSPLISPIPRKFIGPARIQFQSHPMRVGGLVGGVDERLSNSLEISQAKKSSLDAACAELFDIIHSPATSPGPEDGQIVYPSYAWMR